MPKQAQSPEPAASQPVRELGYVSQPLQRAIDIMEMVSEAPEGRTLTELSTALDIPKSSALRLLANLELRGLVEQDELRRYRIGMRMFWLGSRWLGYSRLRACTRPYLEELALRTGENACLAVLDDEQVLYVDRIESRQLTRAVPLIGSHRPLHATAVGKVLLAGLPATLAAQILVQRELRALTAKTVTDPRTLQRQLTAVSNRGYAIDIDEFEEGLTCLGAPIRDDTGTVVAALGLSGPSWRLGEMGIPEITSLLCATSADISRQLGHDYSASQTS